MLKSYSNRVVRAVFFYRLEGFDNVVGLQVFHDVEDNFAGVALLKAIGVGKFAVLKYIGESNSRCHFVGNNFECAANNVALNHDDKRGVVLFWYVEHRYRISEYLLFGASDFCKRTFVGEFYNCCDLSVD